MPHITANSGLKRGAIDWLKLTGELVKYRSAISGQSLDITATLEQDVADMDDMGMVTRNLVASINPDDIKTPGRGDILTVISSGKRYRVDSVLDAPGYLARLFVSLDA